MGMIKNETFECLQTLVSNDLISQDTLSQIIYSQNTKKITEYLSESMNIHPNEIMKFWDYIIHCQWWGVKTEEQKRTVFNEYENIFFKEILKNKGVISNTEAEKNIFKNPPIRRKTIQNLEDLEIILSIPLKNYQIIYIVHPKLCLKIRGGKKWER